MRWIYKIPLRLRSLFQRANVDQELSDELRFHLEKLIEEKVGKGMTPEEARYAALRELGGVEQIKEECRDMRGVNYAEGFFQDVRYGLRMLAKRVARTDRGGPRLFLDSSWTSRRPEPQGLRQPAREFERGESQPTGHGQILETTP